MRKFHTEIKNKRQFGNFYQKWQQKKQALKYRSNGLIIILLVSLSFFTGCSSDNDNSNGTTIINSISPNHGPKGTHVTINGDNFGNDASTVSISINGVNADIIDVSNSEIKFIVPPRAYNGDVALTINETEFTGPYFDYEISEVFVSTFAGGERGNVDGSLAIAKFYYPYSMAFDSHGNMFVVDKGNNRIRKITPAGEVSTFAGSSSGFADGVGTDAQFRNPKGIVIDPSDNIYITDASNTKIRRISPIGSVTTIAGSTPGDADGVGTVAKFQDPSGITIDNENNLYITDAGNHDVKRITPNLLVTTVAGSIEGYQDGFGGNAQFNSPYQITYSNEALYVIETRNHSVRKITLDGEASTITGNAESGYVNGTLPEARFFRPEGIAIDDLGNIYVADSNNRVIRRISASGIVTTLAGSTYGFEDGIGINAKFGSPSFLLLDDNYNLYVADSNNYRIRKITQE